MAAKTEKHPGGRPRKYQTVEEMQKAIDAYFEECDSRMTWVVVGKGKDAHLEEVSDPAPYTVTGLALALGVDRDTLLNYEGRTDVYGDEFFGTIKIAKERVHANLEFRLYDGRGYGPGHIFGLKNNYGWTDKQEVIETSERKVTLRVEYDDDDGDRDGTEG